MGQCVSTSKDQHLKITEIDERCYIAISDEFEYFDYHDEGQSESKKSSKKMSGPETKGTSMSFGFKKKIYNSSANKKLANNNNNNNINGAKEKEREDQQIVTIISNNNAIKAEQNNLIITGDDNGNNAESFTDNETQPGRTTPRLQPSKRDQLIGVIVGRSNRFGFRQNIIRPASTGIQPKFNEFDSINNNTNESLDKRRSKSASARSRVTNAQPLPSSEPRSLGTIVDAKQNSHDGEPQTATIKNDIIARSILMPPQSCVLSKYTLHSTSFPRPQYPVPISVQNTVPAPNRGTVYDSLSSRPPSGQNFHAKMIDTKGAKHAANLTKRSVGMMGRRDDSLDSGIASHDSASERHQMYTESMLCRQSRQRSRHLELIMSGRHKFEIRDLNEFNEDHQVIPLSLPKLPTERKEIVTGGLIRSTNSYNTDSEMDTSVSCGSNFNSRPTSLISTASETDQSCGEEKLKIDNSSSEKSMKGAISKDFQSTNSSSNSSKTSLSNAGETMAIKDCSSISNSADGSDEDRKHFTVTGWDIKRDMDCEEDELSSVTFATDHSNNLNKGIMDSLSTKDQKQTVNDAFMRKQPRMGTISRKDLMLHMDEFKFAEIAEAAKNSAQLDDETSPTDSLVSSSESGDILIKKSHGKMELNIKKPIYEIKEQDLEDITPELISPQTPGTPTHASNSLSLSDGGHDFLIDDEIADQPALVFNDNNGSPSHRDDRRSSVTDTTPTLKEVSMNNFGSLRRKHVLNIIKNDRSSPASIRKVLERAESLDTLSPCDSIASDDLMADFEINSSLDSIDRVNMSHDDLHTNSEAENIRDSILMKEYDAIMRAQQQTHYRNSSRESITSQLPARATRLLNRRLQNNHNSPLSQNGSDSPRSLDSAHSRNMPSSKTSLRDHLKQRQYHNLQSQLINSSSEDLVVSDKSLTNSMLQDVVSFRKQLMHLRIILQEDEDNLMRTETLNPFDLNGQIFNHLNGNICGNGEALQNDKDKKDDENNVVLTKEQLTLLEDQRHELADLRRQVVFLHSQMDDKDRTIKIQQNKIEQYEKEKSKVMETNVMQAEAAKYVETTNCATQTERLRPVSLGQETLTSQPQSNKESKSTNKISAITIKPSMAKSKTQISSVYTKLSSIKPASQTSAYKTASLSNANKGSSIPSVQTNKPVKTTQIGTSSTSLLSAANIIRNAEKSPLKSPAKRIPQLLKTPTKSLKSFKQKSDDSNENSATSSLSTSSSSLNNVRIYATTTMKNELNKIHKKVLLD